MKELIEMQSFNRSQVDQSRLFSLDYETVSRTGSAAHSPGIAVSVCFGRRRKNRHSGQGV